MDRPYEIEELLRHAGWLRALAASLVADPGRADDLVQDTWLAALRRPPVVGESPRPWLARVFRNLARNERRARTTRAAHELATSPERPGPAPDAIAQEVEAQRLLAEAVARLAEPARTIVVLRYFRGLDSAEIGRELGLASGTVRWQLKQALEELRRELDRRFEGGRKAWAAWLEPWLVPASPPVAAASIVAVCIALVGTSIVAGIAGIAAWRGVQAEVGPSVAHQISPAAKEVRVASAPASSQTTTAGTDSARVGVTTLLPLPARERERRAFTVTVRIRGEEPLVPVRLELRLHDGRAVSGTTDASGRLRFDDLDANWEGHVSVPGYVFEDEERGVFLAKDFRAPETDALVSLDDGPLLVGRVFGPHGNTPLAGAPLTSWMRVYRDGVLTSEETRHVLCDESGVFRILLHESGERDGALLFEVEGEGRRLVSLPRFLGDAGLDIGDVVLEPVGELRFRIVDRAGTPAEKADAAIADPGDLATVVICDGDWRGRLPWIPESGGLVRFIASRFVERDLYAAPGDLGDVTLERASSLLVRFRRPDAVAARLSVNVTASAELFRAETPPPGGFGLANGSTMHRRTFRHGPPAALELGYDLGLDEDLLLDDLVPDLPFDVEVRDEGGATLATRTFSLAAGEWRDVEVVLDR